MNTRSGNPKVSVLMPVYNASLFLKEAIDSILAQTYEDYEFLIINDGSTDGSASIIDSYRDKRINHVRLTQNGGIINALNKGLALATGDLIARMDADDVSLPSRLAEQVAFLDDHQEIGVIGTFVETIGGNSMNKQMTPTLLQAALLLDNVFVHSSVMLRKSVLDKYQLRYDSALKHVEDYQLWATIGRYSKLALLPKVLLRYRISETQISNRYKTLQMQNTNSIRQSLFIEILQRPLSQLETTIVSKRKPSGQLQLNYLLLFVKELLKMNNRYGTSELKYVLNRLLIRNIYDVKFRIYDGYHIIVCGFLSVNEKMSILKLYFKKMVLK